MEATMIKEIWMPILGCKGHEVSDQGRVRSLNYNRTGKTRLMSPAKVRGYLQVHLCKDRKRRMYCVHRLVWEAFNGPIPEGMQVNHINEDKTDNRLENLNLMTCKENNNWGTRNERIGKATAKNNYKLKSKMVEQYTLDGEHIMTWFSIRGVQKELGHLGFNQSAIGKCCQGKQKTHKGYIWKYKDEKSLQDA